MIYHIYCFYLSILLLFIYPLFFYFLYNLTSLSKKKRVTYNVINFYLPIIFTNYLLTFFDPYII